MPAVVKHILHNFNEPIQESGYQGWRCAVQSKKSVPDCGRLLHPQQPSTQKKYVNCIHH